MKRSSIYALLSIALVTSADVWATAGDSYQAGIDAFKSSEYAEALQHFEASRQAGKASTKLHYNLGATHYKLGQYKLAAAEFTEISNDPKWGALANYNLGLISQKVREKSEAHGYFVAAGEQATSEKLQRMVDIKLAATSDAPSRVASGSDWTSHLSLGTGYDDNAILADDATLEAVSGESDYFAEAALFTSGYVAGNFADGWRLDLGGYYRGHKELNDFDFGSASVGAMYNRLIGTWHVQTGLRGEAQLAGGDHYTSRGIWRVRAYHRFGDFGVRLTNDLGLIEGAGSFDYLSGTQNRFTAEVIRQFDQVRWRAGYQLEINDRDDLTLTDEFFDYSPTRHSAFGAVEVSFSDRLTGEVRADFRTSNYDHENVEIGLDDVVTQAARDEDRLSATLRLGYRLTKKWQLFSEYQYSDNDSDFDRYSYASSRYRLGIESAN